VTKRLTQNAIDLTEPDKRLILEVKLEKANITATPYCYTIGELFRSSYSSSILGITAEA
jgi:hypothetical protein